MSYLGRGTAVCGRKSLGISLEGTFRAPQPWLLLLLHCFSCCYKKYPNKSNVGKEGFILVTTGSCSPTGSQHQEPEAVGHRASAVRN